MIILTRKAQIGSLLLLLAVSAPVSAETFSERMNLCISPSSINCGGLMSVRLDGGIFYVDIDSLDADEDRFTVDYAFELNNMTSCSILIGSTMIRHGDTLNAQTLDFGSIELDPGETKDTRRTFSFNRDAASRFQHVFFSINGQAIDCD